MKNVLPVYFRFLVFPILITLLVSCGSKPTGEIDAGISDSVNAKYRDNPELQAINKQILDNPQSDSLYRNRANIYIKLKDFELALGDAQRALKIDSVTTSRNYLLLTDIYYAVNETRKAKEVLERCLKTLPKDKDALLKMAELYFYVKKYQESIDMINKALTEDPYMSKAYFLKGMNYMEIGDTSKAINSMTTAVEQDNNYYTAYMQLALLHYFKNSAQCLQYFDEALRISPKSTEALYGKGKYFQDINKIKEAKGFYLQILTIDPKYKNALYNLGAIALGSEKNPNEAKRYFSEALNADPKYTEAYFARGVCFEELKDKKNAIADYKMALQITPNFEPAVTALNKLEGK